MSLTEASKSKGAWLPWTSSSVMPTASSKAGTKSSTPRCAVTTPLGVPVEPLVKVT